MKTKAAAKPTRQKSRPRSPKAQSRTPSLAQLARLMALIQNRNSIVSKGAKFRANAVERTRHVNWEGGGGVRFRWLPRAKSLPPATKCLDSWRRI